MRLAVLPIAWLTEQEEPLADYLSDSVRGETYRDVLTTGLWMYQLHSYLGLVREHFGDEVAESVWTHQQAMFEEEATGAASAIKSAFSLIDAALQVGVHMITCPDHAVDIPLELSVALALLLGLPESPNYQAKENIKTTDTMPPGIDWFLSTQLMRGREQITREFEPVFRTTGLQ